MGHVRLVVETREGPLVATPYVGQEWLVGAAAVVALVMARGRQVARFWLEWRDRLRAWFPRVFGGGWDERWLDPVAEWLASQTPLPPEEARRALRDPVVAAAAVASHLPERVLVLAASRDPQELEQALEQVLAQPELSPAERELVNVAIERYARLVGGTAPPAGH